MDRVYVFVGKNYSESVEEMAAAVGCSTEYLVSKFVEEFLLHDRSGFLLPSSVPAPRGHNVFMTQEVQEKLAQLKAEEAFDDADPVLLRAIIENRVRERRKQEHEATVKK